MPPRKSTRVSAASSVVSTPSKGMEKMSLNGRANGKLTRNNSSKSNVNGKRKRVATSEEEEESEDEIKIKGKGKASAKANPRGVKPYVDISRNASQTSLASSLSRSSSVADLNRSTALTSLRSRRNTSTPATSEPPHTSDGEILTDDSLQFKDEEEEESGSDFKEEQEDSLSEVSELNVEGMELSGDEDDVPTKGKGKKKFTLETTTQVQRKKTVIESKRPGAVIDLDEDEDEEEQMVQAAIKASYASAADAILADLASAGAGPSNSFGSREERMEMSVSPKKKKAPAAKKKEERRSPRKVAIKKTTKKVTKMVVEDEDDSDDDFVESDAMDVDESDGSEGSLEGSASELSDVESEIVMKVVKESARTVFKKTMTMQDVISKQELKKLEAAEKKRLGRKLTYAEKTTIALYRHHPELKTVWGDLEKREVIKPELGVQPEGLKVKLLPFQLESMTWMKKQESGVWSGGMLADEMGMGKTIQTLGLLVNDRRKPNLVVAPTVAIMQWRNEIDQHTTGFSTYVFHGASRTNKIEELKKHDVVLTTYSVLESVFRKQNYGFKRKGQIVKEQSPLHAINWARIILDEAHNIKERSTSTAKAAFELKSTHKWCLSGTPLQNRVGELYSLVRFLGGDPFSYYFCKRCDCKSLHWKFTDKRSCDSCGHSPTQHVCLWNNEILGPIQKHGLNGPGRDAFRKLRILLDRMMLRRTKLERADDLGLPPRTVIVRRDYFSPEEKELYLSLFSDAKRQFSTYVDSGTLLNNYSNIFTLITRMRQMACHPDLVLKSKRNAELAGDIVETTVCRICNDIAEDAIKSKCHHIFDRECIRQYLEAAVDTVPECPVCHLPLTIDLEGEAIEISEEQMNKAKQGILGRLDLDEWKSSSKIEALVEELCNLRQQDRTIKSLVFSQFVNFLDLIAFRLKRAGFNICRLEGTMTPQARDLTIKHFMNNVDVTVFLVSLKAGGVALNLTEASRVYLMDSWWNPAVEFQAMDRIHRLGQHRPVQAIKLVVEDSIESRIVQLQEKKSAMVDATLSTDDSAMGRLTPEDLGFLFRL